MLYVKTIKGFDEMINKLFSQKKKKKEIIIFRNLLEETFTNLVAKQPV